MVLRFFAILFLGFLFFSWTISGYDSAEISSWCSTTPYPQTCKHFLSHNPNYGPIKTKSDFLKVLQHLALARATNARDNTYGLGQKCRNAHEKAAWQDCVELYESTVSKLNETLDPNTKCSSVDVQTWFSTGLTNMETCRAGFIDLGVTDLVWPLMSNNVTDLISNTLAINKGSYGGGGDKPTKYKEGFPSWVSPGDRKLLQARSPASQANVVVAQDGSGNYRTVNEAVAAAPRRSVSGRFVIYVRAGTYNEQVNIRSNNIMLVGDGIGRTIITGSRSVGGGSTTFASATVAVVGDRFIAQGITFRNTAGPQNHQAVALRSGSDLSVFYQCSFEGYQDTLYVHSQRQFYRDCDIYGTVDFIFGNAAVVFQNCNIYARRPPNRTNTLTAQGRTDPNQNTGISIQNSRVTAASDLAPVQSSVRTYLGRPWQRSLQQI